MLLVHMVTRQDRLMLVTQLQRTIRITLQIHTPDFVLEPQGREHFSQHLVDQNLRPKWGLFGDSGLGHHVDPRVIDREIHHRPFQFLVEFQSLIFQRT